MRPNIPTMLQTDWFETSHADLLLAAVIGEAPKPVGKMEAIRAIMREFKWPCMVCGQDTTGTCPRCTVQQIVLQESDPIAEVYNDISGMVKQLLTIQPQPETEQWQDDLDYWAKKNLPSETAGCITAWSDHIAQFIVWRLQERTRR